MRKIITIVAIFMLLPLITVGQKVGYLNSESILSKMPQYQNAKEQLERLQNQYQLQIENELKVVEGLFNQYKAERARLTEAQKEQRESEIINKERAVKEREQELFGQEGVMAEESKKLLEPIMERVESAVKRIAQRENYQLIIDLASSQGVLYSDPKHDLSSLLLRELGIE